MKTQPIIRQGDVLLAPLALLRGPKAVLPAGCREVPLDAGRIVLAYGEVTGHSHAIADHRPLEARSAAADEITDALISRVRAKARLLIAPNGDRFLDVAETVTLRHEEHTHHAIPPGLYAAPTQVEYTPAELRRVAD